MTDDDLKKLSIEGRQIRLDLVNCCAEMLRRNIEATRDRGCRSILQHSHEQYLEKLAALAFELAAGDVKLSEPDKK